MANVKLVFYGTESSETDHVELCCYVNQDNQIYIALGNSGERYDYTSAGICLDKSTAIKLAKTLRTEINKIES